MAIKRANLAREIRCSELAERLEFKGTKKAKRERALEWMLKLGIAMRHGPSGWYFTTLAKLRSVATAEHVWQQFVAEAHRPREE